MANYKKLDPEFKKQGNLTMISMMERRGKNGMSFEEIADWIEAHP